MTESTAPLTKLVGTMASTDRDPAPGVQRKPPEAPPAVRVSWLLTEIASEFRLLRARAVTDGKMDALVATSCELEMALTWTVEASGSVAFWVLKLGAGVSREETQTVIIEMELAPGLSTFLAPDGPGIEEASRATAKVTKAARPLPLADVLGALADEFRLAQAALSQEAEILRFKTIKLKLAGSWTTSAEAGAKFWVLDVAAKGSRESARTITVDMQPATLDGLVASGLHFVK